MAIAYSIRSKMGNDESGFHGAFLIDVGETAARVGDGNAR